MSIKDELRELTIQEVNQIASRGPAGAERTAAIELVAEFEAKHGPLCTGPYWEDQGYTADLEVTF